MILLAAHIPQPEALGAPVAKPQRRISSNVEPYAMKAFKLGAAFSEFAPPAGVEFKQDSSTGRYYYVEQDTFFPKVSLGFVEVQPQFLFVPDKRGTSRLAAIVATFDAKSFSTLVQAHIAKYGKPVVQDDNRAIWSNGVSSIYIKNNAVQLFDGIGQNFKLITKPGGQLTYSHAELMRLVEQQEHDRLREDM